MKVDRRILKTERSLEEALLKLMRGKSIDQITTTELCREAGINRNTFYAHYPNPMNLLQRIEDEFIRIIIDLIDTTVEQHGYSMLLQRVFETIIEHKALSLDMLFTFLSHGAKQVILLWTENGFDRTPAELATKIGTIVDNAVSTFLPKNGI
jgi:AcrR family transcriptional regulator